MLVECPWCHENVRPITQRSSRWRGEPATTPLTRVLIDAGVELVEDWVNCGQCGFNGAPAFDSKSAAIFVEALHHDAGRCTQRGEWLRARRRYVRSLAIFPDYSLALLRLGATFVDAPDHDYERAERILLYGDAAGLPRLAVFDYAIGKLWAVTGRTDDARWRLDRYINRNRTPTEHNRFPDTPTDETNDARQVLESLAYASRRLSA